MRKGKVGFVTAAVLAAGVVGFHPAAALGATPSAASGTINTVPGSDLSDGETFIVGDSSGAQVVFEFDSNGSVAQGRVAVPFSASISAAAVKTNVTNAINLSALAVTASNGGYAVVRLVSDTVGPEGNQPIVENVSNPGFTVVGLSGGSTGDEPPGSSAATGTVNTVPGSDLSDGETFIVGDSSGAQVVFEFDSNGSVAQGRVAVPFSASISAAAVKTNVTNAINLSALAVTASNGGYAVVRLVSDTVGPEGNQPIVENVSNPGFTVVGLSGGSRANQPPVLTAVGNRTAAEGEELTFTISAVDPESDPLTYSASNLPPGASFDPATQTFSWIPGFDQAGSYPNVQFQVSDGTESDAEDITITVGNVLQPTETTMSVVRQRARFKVSGSVQPPQVGEPVTVSLLRRSGGQFREVESVEAVLDDQGQYRASFERPRSGKCRITSSFQGNAEAEPSTARKTLSCEG
jgi:hypothetical protein